MFYIVACAKAFYEAKCKVILCGRNKTSLEDVKKELIEMKVCYRCCGDLDLILVCPSTQVNIMRILSKI
jgi:short-subunit dehydrogenase